MPGITYFKPAGIPLRTLEEVVVTLDELESLRLADLEGLYQEEAAARMKISRPTFSRLVESAHKKVAEALVEGKALRLEGGPVQMKGGMAIPQGNGTGSEETAQGLGIGPCGCGRRRGFRLRRVGGWANRRMGEGPKPPAADEATGGDKARNDDEKG